MIASPPGVRFVSVVTLVALASCSLSRTSSVTPSADVANHAITRVIKTTNWIVPKGHTMKITSSLAVFATGNIEVDGKLVVTPGASLGLIAKGSVTIAGSITSAATQTSPDLADAGGGAPPQTNLDGADVVLDGDSNAGSNTAIATDATGTVTVKGKYFAGNGADGNKAAPPDTPGGAQSGHNISIGSDAAIQQIDNWAHGYDPQFGVHPGKPKKVVITGNVEAGIGGSGYDDVNGVAQGTNQVLTGGDGAPGGDLTVVSGTIEIAKGAIVYAGHGGYGGSAGYNIARKFTAKMDPGRSLVAHLGDGADAGALVFTGVLIGQPNTSNGGPAGDLEYARAGNGAAAQNGGATTIYLGNSGKGNRAGAKRGLDGQPSDVRLSGGGNGGNSTTSTKPGGNGGPVTFLAPKAAPVLNELSSIENYSNAGTGFNGCPTLNGTNGGNGGRLNVLGKQFKSIMASFSGANGGDGVSPGKGGTFGTDSAGNPLGGSGIGGNGCSPFSSYVLPIYIYPQQIAAALLNDAIRGDARAHTNGGNLWFTGDGPNPGLGEISTTGTITMFTSGFTSSNNPGAIVQGSDGNVWFTDSHAIGRMTMAGTVTEFSSGLSAKPNSITSGPDGNLWFTEESGKIGRIASSGTITEFSSGLSAGASPVSITAGPNHNLWFSDGALRIGQITTEGTITEFSGLTESPGAIAAGPDGNLWFVETSYPNGQIGRITPTGTVTEFSTGISSNAANLTGITAGPLNSLWFIECGTEKLGQITTTGSVTEYAIGISHTGIPLNGITEGPDGNIWFVETNNQSIVKFVPPPGALKYHRSTRFPR